MSSSGRHLGPGRVVVGVDGSAESLAALAFAAQEAALRRAALHVVTVREPEPPRRAPYAPPGDTDEEISAAIATAAVDRAVASYVEGVRDMHEHVIGRPPAVLLDASEDADLLVLGRGAMTTVLGPTARACVSAAPCPVVVVSAQHAPRSAKLAAPVGAAYN
jgi:nucleotide-binding universal stress UspA family protein